MIKLRRITKWEVVRRNLNGANYGFGYYYRRRQRLKNENQNF
jgi:hypothetical protein